MREKIKVAYPVIVEGKYDKITLSSVIDADIITTDGFGIFKKSEKAAFIRRLARNSRIILLTDSDGAGKVIRSHMTGMIPGDRLIQLYIPQIPGRERRKTSASAEGTLGVEGMRAELLYKLFLPYSSDAPERKGADISKADFVADGLSGGENSSLLRDKLAAELELPRRMTSNALLAAVRMLCTREEYRNAVDRIKPEGKI